MIFVYGRKRLKIWHEPIFSEDRRGAVKYGFGSAFATRAAIAAAHVNFYHRLPFSPSTCFEFMTIDVLND